MNETFPVLYILVRTDLTSMNAGKAMAQASHASNAFAVEVNAVDEEDPVWSLGQKWQTETNQHFGTVLVLAVNVQQMRFSVDAAKRYGMLADIIHDPTYPIRVDRDLTRYMTNSVDEALKPFEIPNFKFGFQNPVWYDGFVTVPMDTCAYVFADKNEPITGMLLGGYKLHP